MYCLILVCIAPFSRTGAAMETSIIYISCVFTCIMIKSVHLLLAEYNSGEIKTFLPEQYTGPTDLHVYMYSHFYYLLLSTFDSIKH